jgi:hypothetical protein
VERAPTLAAAHLAELRALDGETRIAAQEPTTSLL